MLCTLQCLFGKVIFIANAAVVDAWVEEGLELPYANTAANMLWERLQNVVERRGQDWDQRCRIAFRENVHLRNAILKCNSHVNTGSIGRSWSVPFPTQQAWMRRRSRGQTGRTGANTGHSGRRRR